MTKFRFVSDRGKIDIGIGKYVFTSVENLNGADTSMQSNTYLNTDGAEYENILFEVPSTTIKGFINAKDKNEYTRLRSDLFKILNGKEKGLLYYRDGNREYFTEVLPTLPQIGERIQGNANFVLYFKRYNVYWKNARLISQNVYTVTKKLKTAFTLPCAFSSRINKCTAVNFGDIETKPIFNIKCTAENDAADSSIGLIIKNNTTGKRIELSYNISAGETVTIDTMNYTVASNINGNIINRLKPESEFFPIVCGQNEIEAVNNNTSREIVATVSYYCHYLGV